MSTLQSALALAEEYGLPVFPCRWKDEVINGNEKKSKGPLTQHGFKDASTNIEQITKWWGRWPDALIGVPTGVATKLLVVDVDPDGAPWYAENSARLSAGRVHNTRRGHHLLYRMPDADIGNSASQVAPGIDVRANGGYTIWWPAHGLEAVGDLADISEPPTWLIDKMRAKPNGVANGHVQADIPGGQRQGPGNRNDTLTRLAGSMRRAGFSSSAINDALHKENFQRFDPPLPGAEVNAICAQADKWEQGSVPAADEPIVLLAFQLDQILQPVPAERYLLPHMVPTEAYTLIAGALSAYKTTLLIYLMIWRATGYDLLDLDPGGSGADIGAAVMIFYEDTDKRVLGKFYRILQSGHAQIERVHGRRSAQEFLDRATRNIRRIAFTGQFRKTIVTRVQGAVLPNEPMIAELLAKIREFTKSDVMIGIDPLRLAIVGSQNDDDGADVVVHSFNRLAVEIPDSGLVVNSHTTKSGAQDPAEGYTGKAYSTSGSALYSQHARSNFHLSRLKPDEINTKFELADVPADEHERQPVAALTHGRLSHGTESALAYVRMKDGILLPLKPRELRSAASVSGGHLPLIATVIDDIRANGYAASRHALGADERLRKSIGGRNKVHDALKLLDENKYIEFTGKTSDMNCSVTPKGRAAIAGKSWEESSRTDE